MAKRPPVWIFLAVAAAIALAAFAIGQVAQGAGMLIVMAASLTWVFVVQRIWGIRLRG